MNKQVGVCVRGLVSELLREEGRGIIESVIYGMGERVGED